MTMAVELVERILHGDDDGRAANHLVTELRGGVSVQVLRPLLFSQDDAVVAIGTWVASELGDLAAPLGAELEDLLRHPNREVRFFAVEAVARFSPAAIPVLVDDPDPAVRWKAMTALAAMPQEPSSMDPAAIIAALASPAAHTRRLAAVAAVRLAPHDPGPLRAAAEATDPEIREFAEGAATRPG
ncbi:HEAT repeat domain-containing protein [Actinoplanes sp. NPDC051470]|uniref:HEAT repeat domain-containing protein n=1 Tax=Actinoplanes sp. NPDC051470 TaxID=3157224 RepID=UPI003432CEAC